MLGLVLKRNIDLVLLTARNLNIQTISNWLNEISSYIPPDKIHCKLQKKNRLLGTGFHIWNSS